MDGVSDLLLCVTDWQQLTVKLFVKVADDDTFLMSIFWTEIEDDSTNSGVSL